MKELNLNIEDAYDLNLLVCAINAMQRTVMNDDIHRIGTLVSMNKDKEHKMAKQWSEETQEEWFRMQEIKKQLEHKIKTQWQKNQ